MRDLFITLVVVCLGAYSIKSCTESDWYQESERARKAQEAAEREPHIIRKKDGCDVYAFKVGDTNHFFTKCPNSTVATDRQFDVKCGKNCHRTETESIVTETHQ